MVDAGIYPGYPPEVDLRPTHYHPSVPVPHSATSSYPPHPGYTSYPSYSVPVPPPAGVPAQPNGHPHHAHAPHAPHVPHAVPNGNGNARNLPPIPVAAPAPPPQPPAPPAAAPPAPQPTPPAPAPAPAYRQQSGDAPYRQQSGDAPYRQQSGDTNTTPVPPASDVPNAHRHTIIAEPVSILQQPPRPQPQLPRAALQPQQTFPPPQQTLPPPQPAPPAPQATPPPQAPAHVQIQEPPPAPSTQVSFSDSGVSDAPRSSVSFSTPADSPAITDANAPNGSGAAEEPAQAWVHAPTRVAFLPPATSGQPPALQLLQDSLEAVKDYREFVDTVGRLEYEFGKSLSAAIKKFDTKLDASSPASGSKSKPPTTSLVTAMRAHLEQLSAQAALHQKRPGVLGSQVVAPLQNLEKRGGEATRRLAAWGKDVRGRWDGGRERVEAARARYHTAVREDEAAQTKLRACPPPSEGTKESEWVKFERAAADADAACADRKRAYLVALAGEGDRGGGGWDRGEGGGPHGWGEEARQLHAHVERSLLELLQHHAHEDAAHAGLLRNVVRRAERCYADVSVARDQDAFLAWADTGPPTEHIPEGGLHSSLRSAQWVPPPSEKNEPPVLGTDKQADRNWLVNRWLAASQALLDVEGDPELGKGPLESRRKQLATVRRECARYAANRGLGDADEAWERRVALLRELGVEERKAAVLHAEMACLEAVLGPTPAPELVHDFKERPFAAPQPCDVCGQAVWSPLKSELSCRLCSIALHVRCALLVDPECTGLKNTRRRTFQPHGGRLRRSITSGAFKLRRHSYETAHGAPQALKPAKPPRLEPLRDDEVLVSPFIPDVPAGDRPAVVAALSDEAPRVTLARVRFDYAGESDADLRVLEGEVVRITEPDLDGSGWVKARKGVEKGTEGLVPLAYVGTVGSSTPPLDGGGGRFVHALFDFPPASHHPGPGEVAVRQHEIYELSTEGMAFDHAWAELLVPHPAAGTRIKGVVPKNYIQAI